MIRDPSDGSVREKPDVDKQVISSTWEEKPSHDNGLISTSTSGLPAGSTKPEQIARLNESRKWLADYHAKKASDGQ